MAKVGEAKNQRRHQRGADAGNGMSGRQGQAERGKGQAREGQGGQQ
ncbi:MAG: hypothetical protein HZT43_12440 [Exiguobacterium profundum]|nr:MAG: hypothetical protein HZT43_12440 [Exiguobacterium profundum]